VRVNKQKENKMTNNNLHLELVNVANQILSLAETVANVEVANVVVPIEIVAVDEGYTDY
jgi:hypothetical protein